MLLLHPSGGPWRIFSPRKRVRSVHAHHPSIVIIGQYGARHPSTVDMHTRRRLSQNGPDFRLMGRKEECNFSDEEDDLSVAEELEDNWNSDNATADENSEMFEDDDLTLVDWSEDEGENEVRTDVEGTRTDSVVSQEIGVMTPLSPISKSETATRTSLRRREPLAKWTVKSTIRLA